MIATIKTFFRLNNRKKTLIIQTFLFSVYTSILFTFFNRYARFGRKRQIKNNASTSISKTNDSDQKAKDISWAIQVVNNNIPWRNVCRHQAYQAMLLCNLHKVPCQVFIGFKKDLERNEIQAHAWCVASGLIITGFCNPEEYTVQHIYNNKWQ